MSQNPLITSTKAKQKVKALAVGLLFVSAGSFTAAGYIFLKEYRPARNAGNGVVPVTVDQTATVFRPDPAALPTRQSTGQDRVTVAADSASLPGWPQSTGAEVNSSPTIADLDGDGSLDIIVGSGDGKVYAWDQTGRSLPGWPVSTLGPVVASPAVTDLDGDGILEVVVGAKDGRVYAWNPQGAALTQWPAPTLGPTVSSPAVADLNGDGIQDIVVAAAGQIAVWSQGRQLAGWPKVIGTALWSGPAIAQVAGVTGLAIVAGGEDGKVYVWDAKGQTLPGWPVVVANAIDSTPAVGDVDGDGVADIIVVGHMINGHNFLSAWKATGSPLAGQWPQDLGEFFVQSSPTIADINHDGAKEVLVGSGDHSVYAYHADGSALAHWPVTTSGWVVSSPTVADLDGDGQLEVIAGAGYPGDWRVYAWHSDGSRVNGWPKATGDVVYSSASSADLNGDGNPEVVIGSTDGNVYVWSADGPAQQKQLWMTFRYTPDRTGFVSVVTTVSNTVPIPPTIASGD